MRVLLVSAYDLGRQPFGLASPAAWLRSAGIDVVCADVSRSRVEDDAFVSADVAGFYLPMHTATRLALPLMDRARRANPVVRLCAFGLYAPLNEQRLRAAGVDAVFAGEFEQALTDWVLRNADRRIPNAEPGVQDRRTPSATPSARPVPRLEFKLPDRSGLPSLNRYATLQVPGGTARLVGYTEASRGCKHHCRHCPIVPVYEGRFRVVAPDVVIDDIRAQVNAGAGHITFGDPDFFNGIGHARIVLEAFRREFPGVTYDVTIKVEHLLRHADMLPLLVATGCLFVTSAVESVDDVVLAKLRKGHTRADFARALDACRAAGLSLMPTFLPFNPWTTLEGYIDLLSTIARLDLVNQVAPIQLAIRLLIPNGSRLLDLPEIRGLVEPFDPHALVYPWRHADQRVDALQQQIERMVGSRVDAPRPETFARAWDASQRAAGLSAPAPVLPARAAIPYLTEPWYC